MALKIELRPHERIIVGNVVITNSENRSILDRRPCPDPARERHAHAGDSQYPAKKIYLTLQLIVPG